MKTPHVLVVGAGSIGKRHIKNLLSLGADVSVFRYRTELKDELAQNLPLKIYSSLDEAVNAKHDAIVIANRTDQHLSVALSGAKKGSHLFIEKPLSNQLAMTGELMEIVRTKSLVVEVGCMMRFHPDIMMIRKLLQEEAVGKPYVVRSCIGQFLPDWRPGQDYRKSYCAVPGYGGGVLFDLIHELDFLYWWFGDIVDVSAFLDHVSDLEIETEDVAQLLLRFRCGVVAQVEMDYLSREYRRTCEVVGSNGTITWDYIEGGVTVSNRNESEPTVYERPPGFRRNSMFVDHMKHFLNSIQDGGSPAVSLEDGVNVLRVALAAHSSSRCRKAVRPTEVS